jgi:hypothetical protein
MYLACAEKTSARSKPDDAPRHYDEVQPRLRRGDKAAAHIGARPREREQVSRSVGSVCFLFTMAANVHHLGMRGRLASTRCV